jgi:peptidyl-tRNA hydrolase
VSDLRLYIVFRADLPEMTRAKGEVQAAHAAASMIYRAFTNRDDPDTAQKMFEYMGDFTDEVTEGQAKGPDGSR